MYNLKKNKKSINVVFSASFDLIDDVCGEIRKLLEKHHQDSLVFDIILGCREVLTNAVRHGSKMDVNQTIQFYLEMGDSEIKIRVTDSGTGFDWRTQEKKAVEEGSTSGRGILILKTYFDRYHYNDVGNEVELYKKRSNQ